MILRSEGTYKVEEWNWFSSSCYLTKSPLNNGKSRVADIILKFERVKKDIYYPKYRNELGIADGTILIQVKMVVNSTELLSG